MAHFTLDLARRFETAGITAEAVEDAKGRPCALRFYVDGKAFEVRPELVEGERLRLVIEGYEAEETETPEERLEHVLEEPEISAILNADLAQGGGSSLSQFPEPTEP